MDWRYCKTQLAAEYSYRHQKSYHDIFWARADTEEALLTLNNRFARILQLPIADEPDQDKVREAVVQWLGTHTGWLLILDNIENFLLLEHFLPVERQGAVLCTTRQMVTEPVARTLELDVLPEHDAILFLLKRINKLALDGRLEEVSELKRKAARGLRRYSWKPAACP